MTFWHRDVDLIFWKTKIKIEVHGNGCQTVKPSNGCGTGRQELGMKPKFISRNFKQKSVLFLCGSLKSQISLPKLLEDRTTGPLVDDFKIIVPAVTFRGYSISKACSKVALTVLAQFSTKAELLARTRSTIMAEEDVQMEVQGEEEVGFMQSFCIAEILLEFKPSLAVSSLFTGRGGRGSSTSGRDECR